MGWLLLVGSLKLQVSFAKEPCERDNILQKRPIILRSLLIVATPYQLRSELLCVKCVWHVTSNTSNGTSVLLMFACSTRRNVYLCVCVCVCVREPTKQGFVQNREPIELFADFFSCVRGRASKINIFLRACIRVCVYTYNTHTHSYVKPTYTFKHTHSPTCIHTYKQTGMKNVGTSIYRLT